MMFYRHFRLFAYSFLLFATLGIPPLINGSQKDNATTKLTSFEATDEKLQGVLNRLAEIFGYEIIVDPKWQDFRVNVKCKNTTLEQTLLKVLGSKINHAIVWKESKKHISVIIRDVPSPRIVPSNSQVDNENKNIPSPRTLPNVTFSGNGTKFQQASRTTTTF